MSVCVLDIRQQEGGEGKGRMRRGRRRGGRRGEREREREREREIDLP